MRQGEDSSTCTAVRHRQPALSYGRNASSSEVVAKKKAGEQVYQAR